MVPTEQPLEKIWFGFWTTLAKILDSGQNLFIIKNIRERKGRPTIAGYKAKKKKKGKGEGARKNEKCFFTLY